MTVFKFDISDPTDIVAKDAQDDGDSGGFDELNGAQGVDTFTLIQKPMRQLQQMQIVEFKFSTLLIQQQ